ncbi:MAG: HAD family hydrolase [Gammaproteobacteria bacterium]|nr:HAD family hydrolase [Gammaproteobacteria bacterium]
MRNFGRDKVAFLDRDGVINEVPVGHGYVTAWAQFRFIDGALDALRALKGKGYRLVVVTNQQGIGKGLMDLDALEAIHRKLRAHCARHGAAIDGVFFCPHLASDGCDCRKPRPGLIRQAVRELGLDLDLGRSWLIGDSPRDIEAGAAAGLNTLFIAPVTRAAPRIAASAVAPSLADAVQLL